MFGATRILLTISACALALPATAQAPASTTTAFDGNYVGMATVGRGRATTTCWAINSMDMTITGGQVVIHAIRFTGNEPTLRGSVNTAGEVLASLQIGSYFFSCLERSMTRCSQGSAWSLNAIGASKANCPPANDAVRRRLCRRIEGVVVSGERRSGSADDIERRRLVPWSWLARDRQPAGCRGYAERQVNPTKRPD